MLPGILLLENTFILFYFSLCAFTQSFFENNAEYSGVASSISEGDIFIYSCSGQLSSFEIDFISKELNCPEHEYMNMSPSLIELATPLPEYLPCQTTDSNGILASYRPR